MAFQQRVGVNGPGSDALSKEVQPKSHGNSSKNLIQNLLDLAPVRWGVVGFGERIKKRAQVIVADVVDSLNFGGVFGDGCDLSGGIVDERRRD